MKLPFNPSAEFSVGMEMELQLIDRTTGNLVDGIIPLMDLYPDQENIKPEFVQNTVEVASSPCSDLDDLSREMRALLRKLLSVGQKLDMDFCGAGTHPFYACMAAITPEPRYQQMERASGWLSHNQVTFATHVHMGLPSGQEAVTLMQELKLYLPLLIGLSAASPFWHGENTRFAAFRHRVLAASRTYGTPPDFDSWEAFEQFFSTLERADILSSVNGLHWDIRPRPHLGTLEVRVMDAQPTLDEALSLAALLRALSRYLQDSRGGREQDRPLSPVFWWSLKDNCLSATRYGMEAKFVLDNDGRVASLRDLFTDVLALVTPYADATERSYLAMLENRVDRGLPYERQCRVFEETGALQAVISKLVQELKAGIDR